jgi:hypothetical protein
MLRRWWTLLLVPLLACPLALRAQRGAGVGTQAGWIEQFSCSVEWSHTPEPTAHVLDQNRDRYRFLYVGDRVRCSGTGSLTVQVYEDTMLIQPAEGWCTIRSDSVKCDHGVPRTIPQDSPTSRARQRAEEGSQASDDRQAIAEFGRTAGRTRGLSVIISPASDSVISIDRLAIRWASVATGPARLRLIDQSDRVLWTSDAIDAKAGTVDAQPARRAMTTFRREGRDGDLTLVLDGRAGLSTSVHFALLSESDEQKLDADLAGCDAKGGFLRTVCRVYQFSTRRMWNAATQEYEQALTASPQSEDLLRAALAANQRIGDMDRAKQISTQLPENSRHKP